MAEAFVRTMKRDYVRVSPRPNAEAVLRQLPSWITRFGRVTRLPATIEWLSDNGSCYVAGDTVSGCAAKF
jgi:transposase InsO family protein